MSLCHSHCQLTIRNDWSYIFRSKTLDWDWNEFFSFSLSVDLWCGNVVYRELDCPRYPWLMFDEDMTGPVSGGVVGDLIIRSLYWEWHILSNHSKHCSPPSHQRSNILTIRYRLTPHSSPSRPEENKLGPSLLRTADGGGQSQMDNMDLFPRKTS